MDVTRSFDDVVLEAKDVSYQINRKTIIDRVNLRLERGGFLALIGPNGAGKTTLMRVLSGLARPSQGQVFYEGRPLESYGDRARARRIAVMTQSPQIGFGFSVIDVVAMGRYPHKRRLQSLGPEDWQAVEEAMEQTEVTELAQRRINELSGGERQRVFLARALAQKPSLFFLDEPTSNLDIRHQLHFLELIQGLNAEKGITVVMAIHDLTWALRYAKSVLALKDGQVAAYGPAMDTVTQDLMYRVFGVEGRVIASGDRVEGIDWLGARP